MADQLQRHPTPQRACTENASSGCHRQQKVQYAVEPYKYFTSKILGDKLAKLDNNLLRRLYVDGGNEHWPVGSDCYQF
ncbi:hypothetical protein [Candidatus Spongiihabitans sp.]|uniref:hypothetical protein n=1 Tax=Candidatus Spongiihabitans sp. TaxID=3101308 RepID=UPI003C705DE9